MGEELAFSKKEDWGKSGSELDSPLEQMMRQELWGWLIRKVDRLLTETQASRFCDHFLWGNTYSQIAAYQNVTHEAVRASCETARSILERNITKEELEKYFPYC